MKLATVNVVDRYELKVSFNDEPATRERKYGDAVIITGEVRVRGALKAW